MQAWIQVLTSSISLFVLMLVLVRLAGKRNIARTTPFKFISYIVAAIITALMSLNLLPNIYLGFIALGVWVLLPIALDYLALKSKWAHDVINGKQAVLVRRGKIMEESLFRERMTGEELLRELRSKNAFALADVEFAVMEDTGDINVFIKSDRKPLSAHDLGRKVAPLAEPQTVILDGNILYEPLSTLGFNREWLGTQLETAGVSLDNVFVGQVDSSGDLYLDLFDDSVQLPQPTVKEMLYASLQQSQADLVTYSLETQDKTAQAMYSRHAKKLAELMEMLQPYLLR